ncbi:MAG: ssDNA-binding domain-containing protein, partial [Desulfovibrio sp.]|nr:ssDNA-binding domain-containing protein [Desulfovibrio sp.]
MATQKMFVDQFADRIVEALEKGIAPWQMEWKAGEIVAPFNPATGKRYSGVNLVTLAGRQMETGSADPRYMTAKQAKDNGLQIREGAKGASIQYWQVRQKGRPLAGIATVFHASEIEGMPPLDAAKKPSVAFSEERMESMLRNARVNIVHEDTDRCYYRVSDDTIHVSPIENYQVWNAEGDYYATTLSGLVLASGHPERMNRPFSPKGSEASASEQLRTEIARWMLSADMGLPFEPGRQTDVNLWVENVKKDPHEIIRACRDAEKIVSYVKGLEHGHELSDEQKAEYKAASAGLESAREGFA